MVSFRGNKTDLAARAGSRGGTAMDEQELSRLILRKASQAMNDDDGDISSDRADAFNAYLGREQGPDEEGRSRFTTRETFEVVEWTLPHVIRAFLGQKNVVEFVPDSEDDEEQARLETEIVNRMFRRENYGFMALYSWIKDALMQPVGYIKVYPRTETRKVTEYAKGLLEDEFIELAEDPDVEIEEVEERTVQIELPAPPIPAPPPPGPMGGPPPPQQPGPPGPPPMAQPPGAPPGMADMQPPMVPVEVKVYDVRWTKEVTETRIQLDPLPPEEVLVDRNTTTLDLDQAESVIHRTDYTLTELLEMGYDEDLVIQANSSLEQPEFQDERTNRLFYEDEDPDQWAEQDPSMRTYWLFESYLFLDFDGDGKAERRKVVMLGHTILYNEPVDYQPVVAWSSIPLSHKHNGTSYAEMVRDIQQVQTELSRQMLTNIWNMNVHKKWISEDAFTEDYATFDHLQEADSEWIPVRRGMNPNTAVLFEPANPIIEEILQGKSAMAEITRTRTGVAPNLNVDPNTLQQATASAFQQAQDATHSRTEMLIRVLAETGLVQLFKKWHLLARKYLDEDIEERIGQRWENYNPAEWKERTNVAVNVGLGHANREQRIGVLMAILGEQKEQLGTGMTRPEQVYHTLEKIIEATGMGAAELYFTDPNSDQFQPPPPPPPDPSVEAQANVLNAQAEDFRAKAQSVGNEAMVKLQVEQAKAQAMMAKLQAESEKTAMDMEKAREEMALDRAKLEIERQKLEIARIEAMTKLEEVNANIENTDADSVLKLANARKALAETETTLQPPLDPNRPDEGKMAGMVESSVGKAVETAMKKRKAPKGIKIRRNPKDNSIEGGDFDFGEKRDEA